MSSVDTMQRERLSSSTTRMFGFEGSPSASGVESFRAPGTPSFMDADRPTGTYAAPRTRYDVAACVRAAELGRAGTEQHRSAHRELRVAGWSGVRKQGCKHDNVRGVAPLACGLWTVAQAASGDLPQFGRLRFLRGRLRVLLAHATASLENPECARAASLPTSSCDGLHGHASPAAGSLAPGSKRGLHTISRTGSARDAYLRHAHAPAGASAHALTIVFVPRRSAAAARAGRTVASAEHRPGWNAFGCPACPLLASFYVSAGPLCGVHTGTCGRCAF